MSSTDNQMMEQLKRAVLLHRLQKHNGIRKKGIIPPPILSADRSQALPLSWAQQRLWFLDQLDPAASVAYHIPAGLRLHGTLDRTALQAALDQIIARHEGLRTTFVSVDGQPSQVIALASIGFTLLEHDLRGLAPPEQATTVSQFSADEASQPFDLATGPLIRGQLLQLAEDEHILLITQHHIVSDGWSMGILIREFSSLYAAFRLGQPDPLPTLGIQYADYAAWQRQWLQGDTLQAQIDFWQSHLTGAPGLLELPTDRPRPATQSYVGGSVEFTLSTELGAGLKQLAQRHGSTLFMVLLTGWSILMARLSGQGDIVIGTPVANRQRTEVEALIGFFVNTLALRVKMEGNPSVEQLLNQVKTTTLSAYAHQDIPFEQVVDIVKPERSLGQSPVFQVMVTMDNTPDTGELSLPGLTLSGLDVPHTTTQFDLSLSLSDTGGRVVGSLEYASELFDRATIERFVSHFQTLLAGIVADGQQRISQLPLLTQPERQRLLISFNGTAVDYPQDRLIHQLFEEQAAHTPAAAALTYGGQSLSYQALNTQANQLAHHLISLGVRPDDRVAICVERSLGMVIGLLGILKAGGAYVPLDPGYPKERLAYMLSDSAPVALLTQAALKGTLEGLSATVPVILLDAQGTSRAHSGTDTDASAGSAFSHCPGHNPDAQALGLQPRHLAYVIYTSGSTGQPKGVMVEHFALANFLNSISKTPGISCLDTMLALTTLSFDIAGLELFAPLISGAKIILVSRDVAVNPKLLQNVILENKITVIQATPITWRLLLDGGWKGSNELIALCGGEALSTGLSQRLAEAVHELWNLYGPTETTVWSTCRLLEPNLSNFYTYETIGRPIANTQIYILDAHLQPVPLGVAGEIYIGGAGVARGYLNRPGLTAERFVANPFGQTEEGTQGGAHPHANNTGPSARLYKTGDLGRWLPDGTIEFLGRNDFQVKIRGFRIELGEVESQLSKCPGVREAVVIAREDSPGDKRLVAYLLARDNAELSAADLRSQLAAVLADHQLPGAYVTLESFPLTPNGKLDRKALPAPDGASVVSRGYEAPQGPIETAIARIWQELLQLDQVGRHDHFFELGGHSLLAVQLVSRLRQELDVEVPLRDLFAQATLAGFAQIVTTARQAALPPILSADRSQALPLSWAQQRLWFLDQLDPAASVAYHIPAGLRLHGTLDRTALQAALDQIIARHEGLRTTFVSVDGQPSQVIALASIGFTLLEHDLRGLAPPEQATTVSQFSADEASQPFDLATGPLIRGQLLQLAEDEHILLITQHHIVSDGWSMGILIREFSSLYAAFRLGQPDPLPTLGIQYADYAAWQRQWLQGDTLQAQIDFWQSHLTGAPGLLELPTDRPRPATQSYVGGSVEFTLSTELGAGLKQLAQRHGSTLFMVLLTGWSILMARLSGQGDIVIGTPVANRQRTEVEALIGFFVNTLALRVKMEGNPSVEQLLNQVKTTTLSAYAHQDIPFEQVVDIVKPERSLGQSPVFQVMVTMDNTPDTGELSLPGLTLSGLDVPHTTTQFDLSLSLSDTGGRVVGSLEYASELFDRATIERFVSHFQTLLAGIVADGQQRISQLPLLTQPERQRLLISFNGTAVDYPQDRLIHQLFEEQAAHTPAAAALTYGGQSLSYQALNTQANQLAHHLISLGVRPDDRVAICVERSLGMVIGLLGILKAGGAYVPLDPGYPKERLAYMLSDSAPVALLTQAALKGTLEGLSATVPVILLDAQGTSRAHSGTDTDASAGSAFSHCPGHNPDAQALGLQPRHLAYVIYTSGSTGQPKGVMNEHRGVINRLLWAKEEYQLNPDDRVLQKTPFSFDVSVWEFFLPLLAGAQLVMARPEGHQDPQYLAELIQSSEITTLHFVPSMLQAVLDNANLDQCYSIRRLLCSGEALPYALQSRFMARLPAIELHNLYGPTEAAVDVTSWRCQPDMHPGIVPIGRPIANTQIYILDAHLQPVPLGVAGEIYIGGAGVARGYLNRPGLTAERFVANPFGQTEEGTQGGAHPHANNTGPSARLYKTGDLGRWLPDGTIEFLGRNDFQVKIRGFRIELGEVESQLSKCPGVREAVVIAREDSPGDKRLVAYLLARDNAELSAADLRSQLAAVLADHQLPGAYVTLESFPLTPNGKLDRKALPAPDGVRLELTNSYVAPRTVTEEIMVSIWSKVLGIERVGINDNFFELGGDSIRSLQVLNLAKQQDLGFSLEQIYKKGTIRELVATPKSYNSSLDQQLSMKPFQLISSADQNKLPEGAEDAYPLTALQAGMIFHSEYDRNAYHLVDSLLLKCPLNIETLKQVIKQVLIRHPVLRTSFDMGTYSEPLQIVFSAERLSIEVNFEDWRMLSDKYQRDQLTVWLKEEKINIFDITQAPLIRFHIHQFTEDTFHFGVSEHHAILDGWSVVSLMTEIFTRYLSALYQQSSISDPSPANILRDLVVREQTAVKSDECRSYWFQKISDANISTLPSWTIGAADSTDESYEASPQLEMSYSAELSSVLQVLAKSLTVPLKSVLLSAHLIVLSMLYGERNITTGLTFSVRPEIADADQALGLFLNTLPFPMRLDGGTWNELIIQVFDAECEVLKHRFYPLADIQREHKRKFFDVEFHYLHYHVTNNLAQSEEFQLLESNDYIEAMFTLVVAFQLDNQTSQIGISLSGEGSKISYEQLKVISGYYANVLSTMAENPLGRYDSQNFLSDNERQRILAEFNGTAVDYPQDRLIHQLFEEQAAHTPAAAALTYGGQSLSYQALNTQANQLAHHLISLGVRPDDRVAICVERSLGMVIGLLGILKAGGAYVPLDPGYPKERLAYMLSDSAPVALLTQAALKGTLEGLSATVPVILLDAQGTSRAHSGTDTDASAGSAFSHCPGHNPDAQALGLQPRHLAYVIYTSGSTGQPKGVMVEHGNVARLFAATQEKFNFGVADVWTLFHSFAFDFSVWELWGALMYGGRLVIVSYETSRAPEAFYQLLCQQQVTVLNQTPSSFRQLISAQTNSTDRHALRCVVFGGEALDFHSLKPWIEHNSLEHTQLINMYGITEITVHATYKAISQADIDNQTGSVIGNPLADLRFYILDAHLQPVPLGVAGEIYIGGAGVARGYLNRPGLTAERFVANPFGQTEEGTQGGAHPHANNTGPSARLYKTGDLGRWLPDGTIEFLGRNDFQVKIRGFRIELGEVESQLSKCPGVREAVVIAREDSPGDKRLVAYLLARDNAELSAADLRSQLAAVLADHQLPGAYVTLESFPLTPNGKLDRKALPMPNYCEQLKKQYIASRTVTEGILVDIWADVLNVEQLGINDGFLELGGHSLIATQLVTRLNDKFTINLSLKTLFETDTIEKLAEEVDRAIWVKENVNRSIPVIDLECGEI